MTTEFLRHARVGVCALGMGALALVMQLQPAVAQSVEQFYKGKTVTIWVGTSPGGINDITARFAAKHLGQFIPGNPNISVQFTPCGGGRGTAKRTSNLAA